jgi:two-component system NtrC family sensor kinase
MLTLAAAPDCTVLFELAKARATKEELNPEELFSELEDLIQECQEGSDRVKAIIDDLRRFSHPESGTPQWFDLHQVLRCSLNIVRNQIKYQARVTEELGDLPRIRGFPQELNQVFINLLINAGQAIEGRGEIRIKTWAQGEEVCVEVSDTGIGIPAESLSRVFDPFFTTQGVGKGTGLGLAISYRIVQKHGGEIEVTSRIRQGTTFIVRLPIAGPEPVKEAS